MKNFRISTLLTCLFLLTLSAFGQTEGNGKPDPNFHIYLCFGQSNMQGKGTIEDQDKQDVPERFKMMAAVDFTALNRKSGEWYTAVPPLCRPETALCPADYFGRELVKNLPDSIKVGVINVAVDGCGIEMYDEDVCQGYIKGQPSYMTSAAAAYDNNPFRRLVDLGKKAQESGVIKGILIHQGETNMGNEKWGIYVNRIYLRMLNELGLQASEVPLIAGEMLRSEFGGVCANHIPAVDRLPKLIPNCMVATSENCKGGDQYHFNSAGYRTLGRRYAKLMLKYLESYQTTSQVEASSVRFEDENIEMLPATWRKFHVIATDAEGKETDVTSACQYEVADPDLVSVEGNKLVSGQKTGQTTLTARFADVAGKEFTLTIPVAITLLQLEGSTFNASMYLDATFTQSPGSYVFKSTTNAFGGWVFQQGLDISGTPYVMCEFNSKPSSYSKIYVYDQPDYMAPRFYKNINTGREVTIDLRTLKDSNGKDLDLQHVHFLGLCLGTNPTLNIKSVSLSADGENPVGIQPLTATDQTDRTCYDLQGRRVDPRSNGFYIRNNKKLYIK